MNGPKKDLRVHTAYNALVKGKAVCQGYVSLFYRLILEYDIDSRMITGTSFGKKHAWNIVKLDGSWYHLDTTWASTADTYDYFLKGADYADHKTDDKFKEKAFTKAYPISKTDYKTNIVDHKKLTIITPATTKDSGSIVVKCKKCGKVLSRKTINKIGKVSLSTTQTTYNGKTKSPKVSVKDASGKTISSKYYTVKKPAGRKNVGSYVYTITFKNHYQGKKTVKLLILPKVPTALKPLAAKKAFTAKWKKVTDGQASGFEVQYSTKKNFSGDKHSKKVENAKAVSAKVTGLEKGKTYYVRVRTYKVAEKETLYSAWSKRYSVKVK